MNSALRRAELQQEEQENDAKRADRHLKRRREVF
jgi:hypothetical protein